MTNAKIRSFASRYTYTLYLYGVYNFCNPEACLCCVLHNSTHHHPAVRSWSYTGMSRGRLPSLGSRAGGHAAVAGALSAAAGCSRTMSTNSLCLRTVDAAAALQLILNLRYTMQPGNQGICCGPNEQGLTGKHILSPSNVVCQLWVEGGRQQVLAPHGHCHGLDALCLLLLLWCEVVLCNTGKARLVCARLSLRRPARLSLRSTAASHHQSRILRLPRSQTS
jgi:hypothetical protein